jgi:tRNA(adenine34) deaminase
MRKEGEMFANDDEKFMREAIEEAKLSLAADEVPIGAVAVEGGDVIGRAHNVREATQDPLGHAEMLLIRDVSSRLGSWRLSGVTVYVTCEPCLMCAGAMLQARVKRVVFGCLDPKAGAMGSLYDVSRDERLCHRIEVKGGVLSDECAVLLSEFFKGLRN